METETGLSAELWCDLPEAIWEVILSLLPFSTLVKFRLVCKGWNKLITTASFAQICAKPVSRKGVPLLSSTRGVSGAIVYRCVLPDIEIQSETRPWEKLPLVGGPESCRYLIACEGGLMLFDTEHPDCFVVHNPLTRKWRELECPFPVLPSSSSSVECVVSDIASVGRIVSLVTNRETGFYKLVIVSVGKRNGEGRTTSIYNSTTRAWTIGAPVMNSGNPDGDSCESAFTPGAVAYKGSIYCMLAKCILQKGDHRLWKMAKYDVESDFWTSTSNLAGRSVLSESTRSGLPTGVPDIQFVNVGDRIIIISKVRTLLWLPRQQHSRSIYYNSFATLHEHEGSMTLVEHYLPRIVIRKLMQNKRGGPYSGLPCTFAGYEGSIYFSHQHEGTDDSEDAEDIVGDASVVRVGMFGAQNPEWNKLLPDFVPDSDHPASTMEQGPEDAPRMKIWILEPSLIADV